MKVLVCGAGHQGITMAGHLAISGYKVNLWNRSKEHIQEIENNRTVYLNGIYNGKAVLNNVSTDIKDVISDIIMVTTPSNAHKDIAKVLAPYVHKDMVIILNPGRTFGAIEFASVLLDNGVTELPHIAETQTIVYTCRKNSSNSATIFAIKNDVGIAALSCSDISYIMSRIPACLKPNFSILPSVALTSFSNVGMILHCAPVLMNIGWIESPKTAFKYYYEGITESISRFIEKMDSERIDVAKTAGFDIETTTDWMKRTYQLHGNTLYECIRSNSAYQEIDAPPSIFCRYTLEDIPNGLVPIEKIGQDLSVPTPNISTVIDLANSVLCTDFRKSGRVFTLELIKKYF